ncbi:N-acetylmuramoyl-L-alanine amidase [Flavobacterium sp.]|jgi:N-acetylmuramoyl-L-alanine amidase|uniref:N-acetylmuramoyl-L-alanine amidase n=1 Tax=Flavobacterium sp. TaxID=239 RepID=UPI0037BEDA8F
MAVNNTMKYLLLSLVFISTSITFAQQSSLFKVVLDAGHGGKDPGTMRGTIREKDIVLDVVLRLGKMLEQQSGVKVIYTRKTDVFIELRERAQIANKAKANLFVSVHCNGVKSPVAKGTETFVMGMSRTDTNLDIAKKENGVIFLEDDYNQKYKGFDPNNPETLLGLKILQEEFLGQSIELASEIEKNFQMTNRFSRGVKQQPIWVLDATVMPGVLVELGFVSHPEEGLYISSEAGKDEMAQSLFNSIIAYKNTFFNPSEVVFSSENHTDSVPAEPESAPIGNEKGPTVKGTHYKVQLEVGNKKIDLIPSNFKGLDQISVTYDNNKYKYFYGLETDFEACRKRLAEAKSKGYKSAYIVTFDTK